ncbi:MAG TPA: hypothetical protein VFA94_14595 [Acidimicrobiales bacterium]|nr:hypothetical protein [Acidimicrobiales bacterium]
MAAISKWAGVGRSCERCPGTPALGHTANAVLRASASLSAQHTVAWPYVGLASPPAWRNARTGPGSGVVLQKPSPTRPANWAARSPDPAMVRGGADAGMVKMRASSTV